MSLDLKQFATKIRVTDGVYGTVLQKHGLGGNCPELLNVENPTVIEAIAREYVEAGSDVIMTNTLGANRFILARHGLSDKVGLLAEAGARLSKQATENSKCRVFGSFGPTGKLIAIGEVSEQEVCDAFSETSEALARGGAEAIVLETFTDLSEVELALKGVARGCGLAVVISMTFGFGPEGLHTCMGNSTMDLVKLAEAYGVQVVGANCGTGPADMLKIMKAMHDVTDLPLWCKPNGGLPQAIDGETVFSMGPDEFASHVKPMIDTGVAFIGGVLRHIECLYSIGSREG